MMGSYGVALIYVRRSMVRYEQDRASPERQLANCVRVCEERAVGCERAWIGDVAWSPRRDGVER